MIHMLRTTMVSGVMVMGSVAPEMLEQHAVNLGTVAAVASVVVPAVWWLSKRFQSIDDEMKATRIIVEGLACHKAGCMLVDSSKPVITTQIPLSEIVVEKLAEHVAKKMKP